MDQKYAGYLSFQFDSSLLFVLKFIFQNYHLPLKIFLNLNNVTLKFLKLKVNVV